MNSTIGRKVVMAVSGIVIVGFVVAHMAGNLQVYFGPTKLDEYGAALRHLPALLWTARLGLLVAVVAHVWAAWSITRTDWSARPVGYDRTQAIASSYASRTMRLTGIWLLLFIVYHLLHFTFGTVHPTFVEGAITHNFVDAFRSLPISIVYILSMLALGLHMYHGIWSLMQTLGISHPRYDPLRRAAAGIITAVVVAGNISFPIAVLTGYIKAPPVSEIAGAPQHGGGR